MARNTNHHGTQSFRIFGVPESISPHVVGFVDSSDDLGRLRAEAAGC